MVKKVLFVFLLAASVAAAGPALAKGKGGGGGKAKDAGRMNVQVREETVRSTPNYMGTPAGKVSYGAQVNVVGDQGNWYRIDSPSGWIPKSAVTGRKVAVNPDQKFSGGSAKHDEVALAGKGFNPQVEAQYRKDNANLAAAYAAVDRIEKFGASEGELKAFQAVGKLTPR